MLLAALVVENDVLVQQFHERVHGDAIPVPIVEELVLEAAEEAFASRVVRAAALLRHGPGQAVSLAYADPAGPSVMASPVRVADRVLARGERPARVLQGAVGERRARAPSDPPCHDEAVVAVDDRAEVRLLLAGQLELGDVGEPQLVRRVRVEVAPHQVGGRVRYLPLVGVVAPLPLQVGDLAALFGHQPAHDLLADDDAAFPQLVVHVPVAPRAAGAVEYPPDIDPELGVLVLRAQLRAAVLIGALRDPQGIGELS